VAAGRSAEAAAASAAAVNTRADSIEKASKRIVYEVVLNEEKGNFKFGKTELPDEAKARLDEIVTTLKSDPKAVYIEIEGHTDNVGSATLNERLGMERAETVKRYLYEQHQVPLHKINVISYGEEKPIAPNKTKAGRAQNRRVVIKVLT
jgi:peptidoglycan-associated lipoprotein